MNTRDSQWSLANLCQNGVEIETKESGDDMLVSIVENHISLFLICVHQCAPLGLEASKSRKISRVFKCKASKFNHSFQVLPTCTITRIIFSYFEAQWVGFQMTPSKLKLTMRLRWRCIYNVYLL